MTDQQQKDMLIEMACSEDYIEYQETFYIGDFYWELVKIKERLGCSLKDELEWQNLHSLIRHVEDECDVDL